MLVCQKNPNILWQRLSYFCAVCVVLGRNFSIKQPYSYMCFLLVQCGRWQTWAPAWEWDRTPREKAEAKARTLGPTLFTDMWATDCSSRSGRTYRLFLLGPESGPSDLDVVYLSWESFFPFRWITQDTLAYVDMSIQHFLSLLYCGSGFLFCFKSATDLHAPGH